MRIFSDTCVFKTTLLFYAFKQKCHKNFLVIWKYPLLKKKRQRVLVRNRQLFAYGFHNLINCELRCLLPAFTTFFLTANLHPPIRDAVLMSRSHTFLSSKGGNSLS